MVPQTSKVGSRRLAEQLMPSDNFEVEVISVFRCHIEMDLAIACCPGEAVLGRDHLHTCAEGYTGSTCNGCADDYGMSSQRLCEPCEDSGYTPESLLLLSGVLLGIALIVGALGKLWKAFQLKHLFRCAFQPVRILITYSQVTSQLGDVLDFSYPGMFGDVIKALKPFMDMWGLLFQALGPSECYGIKGFTSKWLLRIVGMPSIFVLLVLVYWLYDKKTNLDKDQPYVNAISHLFFAVFFCYPTICIVSFASFICRVLAPDVSVLDSDDNLLCSDPGHRALQTASGVVIAVVAIGLPVVFAVVLLRAARQYNRESARPNEALARRVADEMDVDKTTAAWVIRDVTIGRGESFMAFHGFSLQFCFHCLFICLTGGG